MCRSSSVGFVVTIITVCAWLLQSQHALADDEPSPVVQKDITLEEAGKLGIEVKLIEPKPNVVYATISCAEPPHEVLLVIHDKHNEWIANTSLANKDKACNAWLLGDYVRKSYLRVLLKKDGPTYVFPLQSRVAEKADAKPILTPAQVENERPQDTVTVTFQIAKVGRIRALSAEGQPSQDPILLTAKANLKDARNAFQVIVAGNALVEWEHKFGIIDPEAHYFAGQMIEATGKIEYRRLPQITRNGKVEVPADSFSHYVLLIESLDQIRLVPRCDVGQLIETMEGFRNVIPPPLGIGEQNGPMVKETEPYLLTHLSGIARRLCVKTKAECLALLAYLKDPDGKIRYIAIEAIESVVHSRPDGMSIDVLTDTRSEAHRKMVLRFIELIDKLPD